MLKTLTLDLLLQAGQLTQTGLPDLTQPQYLDRIASQLPLSIVIFMILAIGLTAGMALFNFSLQNSPLGNVAIGDWMMSGNAVISWVWIVFDTCNRTAQLGASASNPKNSNYRR
jgi:hypothetical protein